MFLVFAFSSCLTQRSNPAEHSSRESMDEDTTPRQPQQDLPSLSSTSPPQRPPVIQALLVALPISSMSPDPNQSPKDVTTTPTETTPCLSENMDTRSSTSPGPGQLSLHAAIPTEATPCLSENMDTGSSTSLDHDELPVDAAILTETSSRLPDTMDTRIEPQRTRLERHGMTSMVVPLMEYLHGELITDEIRVSRTKFLFAVHLDHPRTASLSSAKTHVHDG
jgi:hypothetical protein